VRADSVANGNGHSDANIKVTRRRKSNKPKALFGRTDGAQHRITQCAGRSASRQHEQPSAPTDAFTARGVLCVCVS
jgi:hypothetical protein